MAADSKPDPMKTVVSLIIALVIINGAFFGLSYIWGKDQGIDLTPIRVAFATLCFLIAVASVGAAMSPRLVGHVLTVVAGVSSLGAGIAALVQRLPGVMGVTLVIIGCLLPILAHFSWRHSRAAWSVMISTLVVFGAVTFFGAPKIRGILHVGLWWALVIPAMLIVGVVALSMVRAEYHDNSPAS